MVKITLEITKEIIFKTINFIKNNLNTIVWIGTIILPYLMYYLCKYCYETRGKFAIGGEALIPVIFYLITFYLKEFSNKIGKGPNIPIPRKRFTTVDDGAVEIEHKRLQELILYMNDLENWMEKRDLL